MGLAWALAMVMPIAAMPGAKTGTSGNSALAEPTRPMPACVQFHTQSNARPQVPTEDASASPAASRNRGERRTGTTATALPCSAVRTSLSQSTARPFTLANRLIQLRALEHVGIGPGRFWDTVSGYGHLRGE